MYRLVCYAIPQHDTCWVINKTVSLSLEFFKLSTHMSHWSPATTQWYHVANLGTGEIRGSELYSSMKPGLGPSHVDPELVPWYTLIIPGRSPGNVAISFCFSRVLLSKYSKGHRLWTRLRMTPPRHSAQWAHRLHLYVLPFVQYF